MLISLAIGVWLGFLATGWLCCRAAARAEIRACAGNPTCAPMSEPGERSGELGEPMSGPPRKY